MDLSMRKNKQKPIKLDLWKMTNHFGEDKAKFVTLCDENYIEKKLEILISH